MIAAILFYLAWLSIVFLAACFFTALYRLWWSLYALSCLEKHAYTMIACTAFDDLHTIKPLCDQHGISYNWIYFGRLCGRAINAIRGER
jgi:putative component of membrane protein insertase Oxa1/YidC/SpoIIIJ protein YidD